MCYLYGWPPSVPLRELSLDQVMMYLAYGEEAQRLEAEEYILAYAAAMSGHWKDRRVPPEIIQPGDEEYQPADLKAVREFMQGRKSRGR